MFVQKYWAKLVTVGVQQGAAGSRYVAFLNSVVLLVLVLIVQNFGLAAVFYPATLPIILTITAHFVVVAATLLWNFEHRYVLARVWFGLGAALFLTIFSVALGRESYWELFLAGGIFLQFYIFPPEDRGWMVFVILVWSVCFVGAHFFVPARGVMSDLPAAYVGVVTVLNLLGFLFGTVAMGTVGYVAVNRAERNLLAEHQRSERLLHNILPITVAQRLKDGEESIADSYESATVLFFDLVNFTPLAAANTPADVVQLLSDIFGHMDSLVERHEAEKLETVGDSYMAAAGLSGSRQDHATIVADLALAIQAHFQNGVFLHGRSVDFRIGINTGPLMAGVIGRKKISYKVWGDTVNMASRMESHSLPGHIQISEATYRHIAHTFSCEPRGPIEIKGKGVLPTYLLKGRLVDETGRHRRLGRTPSHLHQPEREAHHDR
jgi:adenylate cyclase